MPDELPIAPIQLLTPAGNDLLVGAQVGEYRVLQRIGAGGMGVVYAGEQPLIGKKVAIKVLLPQIAHEDDAIRRFLQEARSANQIGHRNIIDIFSFGTLPDGRQYLVMEFLNGQALDEVIRERAPLQAVEAVHLLDDVASGLAAAHAAGILHRDLKPSNLFVVDQSDGSSYVKILDFGLAKTTERRDETSPSTRYGTVMGTPEYMAPEQARGEDLDHRVDMYAFGVIAFELLTGRLPFQGKSELETISKHLTEAPPEPSSLHFMNRDLELLVLRLLEKDRDRRPASMGVVRSEFRRIRKVLQSEATQIGPPSMKSVSPRSKPNAPAIESPKTESFRVSRVPREWMIAALAATLGIVMAVVALVAFSGKGTPAPAPLKEAPAPTLSSAPAGVSAPPPPISAAPTASVAPSGRTAPRAVDPVRAPEPPPATTVPVVAPAPTPVAAPSVEPAPATKATTKKTPQPALARPKTTGAKNKAKKSDTDVPELAAPNFDD
jgi:serine/threonine protein kinase